MADMNWNADMDDPTYRDADSECVRCNGDCERGETVCDACKNIIDAERESFAIRNGGRSR